MVCGGGEGFAHTWYPFGIHFPFDTICSVRTSISGLAATTSSYALISPTFPPFPFLSPPLPFPPQKKNLGGQTHNSQLLKRPRLLDILQRNIQALQLVVYIRLRLLRAFDGLRLKGLDGLDLPSHVVRHRLEALHVTLDFVHDGPVRQHGAVLREVDRLRRRAEQRQFAARVVVALFEGEQRGCRLPFEAERGADFGPV